MRPGGLTAEQYDDYLDTLSTPAAYTRVTAQVIDLADDKPVATYEKEFLDASTRFNRGEDVPVSNSLTLVDLDDALADLDVRYALQLRHGVDVPGQGWVWVPAGRGVVATSLDDGDTATLDLHGFERLGMPPTQARMRTWEKGMPVAAAIRDMWEDLGVTRVRISRGLLGDDGPRLTSDVESGGPDPRKAPTFAMRRMARMRDLQAFFDLEGILVVRRPPTSPVVTWREDDDLGSGDLRAAQTSPIRWTRDFTELHNVVAAKGKKKLSLTVDADDYFPDHAFAPSNMRVGGKPRRLVRHWADESIARERALREGALGVLRRELVESSDVSLSCVPTLVAGPWDLARAQRRDGRWTEFYPQEAEIPLLGDGDMTVGYQVVTRPGSPRRKVRSESPNRGKGGKGGRR